jgi:hypothetical protein
MLISNASGHQVFVHRSVPRTHHSIGSRQRTISAEAFSVLGFEGDRKMEFTYQRHDDAMDGGPGRNIPVHNLALCCRLVVVVTVESPGFRQVQKTGFDIRLLRDSKPRPPTLFAPLLLLLFSPLRNRASSSRHRNLLTVRNDKSIPLCLLSFFLLPLFCSVFKMSEFGYSLPPRLAARMRILRGNDSGFQSRIPVPVRILTGLPLSLRVAGQSSFVRPTGTNKARAVCVIRKVCSFFLFLMINQPC